MQARNKNQRRVVAVNRKMKPVGKRIENWAKEHLLETPAVRNKSGNITCMKCNHKWKSETEMAWHDEISETKCPNCKKELKVRQTQKRTFEDNGMFSHVTTLQEYQVIRTFQMYAYYKTNKKPRYYIQEGFRIYIDKDGNREVVGCLRGGGFYSWTSSFVGMMELRNPKAINQKYSDQGELYPKWKLQDFSIKAGFNAYSYAESKYNVSALLKVMLTVPNLETIQKSGDEELYKYCYQDPDDIKKYWSTLRICWRNKYIPNSWRSYFDMIKAMNKFGKDLRNRHYVCPENFNEAHNYWTDKAYQKYKTLSDIREEKRREREKLNNIEYQKRYKARLKREKKARKKAKKNYSSRLEKFSELKFTFGDLVIIPLLTLKEVKKAGKLMHHCIYKTSSYWTDEDNLLFGSYWKGKLIETSQYSLSEKKVYHSYGVCNEVSEHHDKIIKIIETGRHKITKHLVQKRTKKDLVAA